MQPDGRRDGAGDEAAVPGEGPLFAGVSPASEPRAPLRARLNPRGKARPFSCLSPAPVAEGALSNGIQLFFWSPVSDKVRLERESPDPGASLCTGLIKH